MPQTFHYEATFSNGQIAKRKSPRTYTHAIGPVNGTVASWAGSLQLAQKAASVGREIAEARLVKITGNKEAE